MAITTFNPNGPQVPSIFDIAGRPAPTVPTFSPATPAEVMFNWNGQLTECSLKAVSGPLQSYGTVSFPVEECNVSFSQDVVQHKRPNVPGARVESTGFNPITFKVKAPFLFNLQKGKGETWGDLYPATFSQVFNLLTDTVAPVLVFTHPTMGQFTVKPQSGSTPVSGAVRNGQILEFELIQSNEDDTQVSNITGVVEFGNAVSAATLFDNTIVKLVPAPPSTITNISLTQLLQQVRGVIDQSTLLLNQIVNVVSSAINQVNLIRDALIRLKSAATGFFENLLDRVKSGLHSLLNNQSLVLRKPPAGRVTAHPLITPIPGAPTMHPPLYLPPGITPPAPPNEALIAAEIQAAQALASNKQVTGLNNAPTLGVYTVTVPMTLASVALLTHNTIDVLIKLNPAISKTPTLTVGTQVVYQVVVGPSPRQ